MTTEQLKEWEAFLRQYKNGYHLSKWDWTNFIRLNHLVMEASHEIHNQNMIGVPEKHNKDCYMECMTKAV